MFSLGNRGGGDMDMEEDEVYQYSKTKPGPVFAAIEDILRCAICRGVSDPPLSLPCCQQLFCSFCIREYLVTTKPRCPSCRCEAEPSKLILSKGLRSVCTLWKQNRLAIVAAANAAAQTAKDSGTAEDKSEDPRQKEGGADTKPHVPAAAAGGRMFGRQAGGGGQVQERQRIKGVYYSGMKEAQMRTMLKDLGLPHTGGKAAMEKRHRRLVLLDAASRDRETPVPRHELIGQVIAWSREKDREANATARQAGSLVATFSGAGSSSASLLSGSSGGASGSKNSSEVPKVPDDMKPAFDALVKKAKAQMEAKKRAMSSNAAGDSRDKKRPRTEARAVPDTPQNGSVSLVESSAGAPAATAQRCGVTDGREMQILGVAGRMVRTSGPWRCAVATGVAALPSPTLDNGTTANHAERPGHDEEKSSPTTNITTTTITATDSSEPTDTSSSPYVNTPDLAEGVQSESENSGGTVDKTTSSSVEKLSPPLERRIPPEGTGAEAGAVALEDPKILYLNPDTGGTARVPPPELLAEAEAAEKSGGYLVFVPSRVFVASTTSSTSSAPSSVSASLSVKPSEAATDPVEMGSSRLDSVRCGVMMATPATADGVVPSAAGTNSRSSRSSAAVVAVAAPVPPAATLNHDGSTPRSSDNNTLAMGASRRQGVETWDRLSAPGNDGSSGSGKERGQQDEGTATTAAPANSSSSDAACTVPSETSPRLMVTRSRHGVTRGMGEEAASARASSGVTSPELTTKNVPVIDLSEGGIDGSKEEVGRGESVGDEVDGGGHSACGGVGGKGEVAATGESGGAEAVPAAVGWACGMCTLQNRAGARFCAVCRNPRPKEGSNKAQQQQKMTQSSVFSSSSSAATCSSAHGNDSSSSRTVTNTTRRRAGSRLRLSASPSPHHRQQQSPQSTITSLSKTLATTAQNSGIAGTENGGEAVTASKSVAGGIEGPVGFPAVKPRERSVGVSGEMSVKISAKGSPADAERCGNGSVDEV